MEFIGLNMEGLVDYVLNLNCMSGEQEEIARLKKTAGDTNFVYPGRVGKPMLTLRYKLLQKRN